jgi:hypothetical protein
MVKQLSVHHFPPFFLPNEHELIALEFEAEKIVS